MRTIVKSGEPQSLQRFNRIMHNSWDEIHLLNNQHVYDDCLNQCEIDQNYLCCYTEIPVIEGIKHIDHYIKRDLDPSLTFAWENMVCAIKDHRFGADWKDNHISLAGIYDKNGKCYSNLLNPLQHNLKGRFRYSTDGEIEPSDISDSIAENTIKVFNLNEKSLKTRRKEVMQFVRCLQDGGMDKSDIFDCLSEGGFLSVIEYELSVDL